ncbi:MAG TPA: hypothetical protein VHJ34_03665 [Actinomycetota bacterium]|nr:hypothetical protein [Actinomycetota bacterium]
MAALTAIGITIYGVVRIDYVRFYGDLGVGMEEVGLGYSEVLQASVAGLAILALVLLILAALVVATFVLLAVAMIVLTLSPKYEPTAVRDLVRRAPSSRRVARALVVVTLAVLVTIGAILGDMANERSNRVQDGAEVHPIVVRDVLDEIPVGGRVLTESSVWLARRVALAEPLLSAPVLNVKAAPAKIEQLSDGEVTHQCVMYLGAANGGATFFDHDTDQVIRLPAASARISAPSDSC